jgi:ABC-type transport system involved in multi-copper enzyme maturation permease subunit
MLKRLTINPILKKEALVSSRNAKITIAVTLINALFTVIVAIVFAVTSVDDYQGYYQSLGYLFPGLAACELVEICLVIPVLTATSISGERERQTLDIMLTTPVKPISIVVGKLMSAMATTFIYVVSSLPFMAVAFVVGGLSWWWLLAYLGVVLFVDIYIGSIGVFYSSIKRSSVSSTIATIATIVAIVILTLVIAMACSSAYSYFSYSNSYGNSSTFVVGWSAIFQDLSITSLMINPVAWIVVVLANTLLGSSSSLLSNGDAYYTFVANHFALLSVIINLLIAWGFIFLASRKVVTGGRKKIKKKRQA